MTDAEYRFPYHRVFVTDSYGEVLHLPIAQIEKALQQAREQARQFADACRVRPEQMNVPMDAPLRLRRD